MIRWVFCTLLNVNVSYPSKAPQEKNDDDDDDDDLQEAMRFSRFLDCHAKLFVRNKEDRTSSVGFMFHHVAKEKGPRSTLEEDKEVHLDYVLRCTKNWAADRLLGEGGYGKVYRATDSLGTKSQEFAAKRLECKSDEEREALKKVTDAEIKTFFSFRHPNIVKLLGFCKTADMAVLLYEYEPAGSVDRHLEDSELAAKLSWPCRSKIVKGLLAAIHHLHTYDPSGPCYHRDVKPGNMVLTASVDLKLIDCGLARLATPTQSGSNKTLFFKSSTGSGAPGTPGFKCPKYERTGVFNEKSEMYSVGVTILQTLGVEY